MTFPTNFPDSLFLAANPPTNRSMTELFQKKQQHFFFPFKTPQKPTSVRIGSSYSLIALINTYCHQPGQKFRSFPFVSALRRGIQLKVPFQVNSLTAIDTRENIFCSLWATTAQHCTRRATHLYFSTLSLSLT